MNEVYEAFMLGGQEIEKLRKELQRKDNNWNELKKYVESKIDNVKYNSFDEVLDKIKELENDN